MTLNIELLRDAVAWAEAEAKKGGQWDQNHWAYGQVGERRFRDERGDLHRVLKVSCGTSFCVAGNICASAGDRFVVDYLPVGNNLGSADYVMPKGSREVQYVRNRAVDLLGCDVTTCDEDGYLLDLFDGDNSIEEVRRIAELIAAEHGFEL